MISLVCLCAWNPLHAQTGSIKGTVVDKDSQRPLAGVTVQVVNTKRGASSRGDGSFAIDSLAPGSYVLAFSMIGYSGFKQTDVIVRPGRITRVDAALSGQAFETEGVTVESGFFRENSQMAISAAQFNAEEIRRMPGTAGDVSRIVSALPSVIQKSDEENNLLVRGGLSNENGFYIDNIYIPNINHFPEAGTSGGGISILNVDFIRDLSFSAGGFSAAFGNRLSAMADVRFREGNREEFDGQLDLNIAGFGGTAEGPWPGGKGSWLISTKRSYIDLIADAIGTEEAPTFGDVHAKFSYDLDDHHSLYLLNIYGDNLVTRSREESIKEGYGSWWEEKAHQNTTGLTWRWLWGENGYTLTSISYSFSEVTDLDQGVDASQPYHLEIVDESSKVLRSNSYLALGDQHKFEAGFEAQIDDVEYTQHVELPNTGGDISRGVYTLDSERFGVFLSYTWTPLHWLDLTAGLRADHYSLRDETLISPRGSMNISISPQLRLKAAAGLYRQTLPLYSLAQFDVLNDLKHPQAVHLIAGVEYDLTSDTRVGVEVYNKDYSNFPMARTAPYLFLVDRSFPFDDPIDDINDLGTSWSRGVEFMLQKKLAENFHGLISATWFRSRYEDLNGVEHNRLFDNRYALSVIGGYKLGRSWEFSVRFNLSGGRAYTPFDVPASIEEGRGVRDRNRLNDDYLPDYQSLNLRADHRFFFESSNLTMYISVWNVYNRENVMEYYWGGTFEGQKAEYQFGLIPLAGFEFEF